MPPPHIYIVSDWQLPIYERLCKRAAFGCFLRESQSPGTVTLVIRAYKCRMNTLNAIVQEAREEAARTHV